MIEGTRLRSALRLVPLCALATTLACGPGKKETSAPPAAQPSPTAAPAPAASPAASTEISKEAHEEAEDIFKTRCSTCHGPEGMGDGPASAGLSPRPRNFTDPEWQKSVTDEHIETIIQYGGAAVGRSPAMPANPDLTSKPQVVAALREHVRTLGKK